jgi:hypothetical protein
MEKKKWDDVQQRARVAHDWAVNFFLFFHPAHPLHVAPPSWWWWRRKVHTSQSHAQMIQHRKIPLNRINFHLLLLLLLLKRNSKNRIFLNIKKKKEFGICGRKLWCFCVPPYIVSRIKRRIWWWWWDVAGLLLWGLRPSPPMPPYSFLTHGEGKFCLCVSFLICIHHPSSLS